ncbi:SAM-dependent methyltransferase [Nonomuraea sp. NPDC050202]|uniref:SAM-dependent methyltransferase n=1 Tax=Nonomuraea sp. NPDC050202 TaxID=3155035 RepID=UPI0033F534C0
MSADLPNLGPPPTPSASRAIHSPAPRERAPEGIDPSTANVARMYDYFLGGKDNYQIDRDTAERTLKKIPELRDTARANRNFLGRAVTALAEEGIDQFLDFGSGLPTQSNVHEIAQQVNPDVSVVYVDMDVQVACHGRALLASDHRTSMVQADIRDMRWILAMPEVTALIDFDRPVAMLMVAVLHFLPDDDQVAAIVDTAREHMADGSRLVLSHGSDQDLPPGLVSEGLKIYNGNSNAPMTLRDSERLQALLPDWTWADPPGRIVPVSDWRSDEVTARLDATRAKIIGGVAIPPPHQPTPTTHPGHNGSSMT